MLIYAEILNARFRYAAENVFRHYEGELRFTDSPEELKNCKGPAISYASAPVESAVYHIPASAWIWKDGIQKDLPGSCEVDGMIYPDMRGDGVPDVFASVFFFLSRYEEYVIQQRDHHARFVAAYAWKSELKWMDRPLVDIWIHRFMQDITRFYPEVKFSIPEFTLTASIDVDSAFAYRYKGFIRSLGGAAKDLVAADLKNLARRVASWIHILPDPYDTYDYIVDCCEKNQISLIWFFLLADKTKEDVNVSHRSKRLRTLIQNLSAAHLSGIHPGYASNAEPHRLLMEKGRLEEITASPVTRSRQHYLKMELPVTYRRLIDAGIQEDYTMGYFDRAGYRAGTAQPFYWFDLEKNEKTRLRLFPFQVMDTTLQRYQQLDPEAAIHLVTAMMEECKKYGGQFMILWHNESLSEQGRWRGWRKVWEKVLGWKG